MTTSLKKTLLAALVVPAIALTAACTSGSDDKPAPTRADAGGTGAATAPKAEPQSGDALAGTTSTRLNGFTSKAARNAPDLAADLAPDLADGAGSRGAAETGGAADQSQEQPQSQAIISKGQISLHSKDISAARFKLQQLLDSLDGTIADEQSDANKQGVTIRQRLELRVPSARFGKAMDEISGLGTLVSRSRSSKDVTTQVIDNNTRIRTQKASLARIQALLGEASSLREVISIEAQLSRRQADLDSLEAQQKYLADQTSLSTIDVYLTVPSKKAASTHHGDDDNGFFSGLKSGWHHLGTSTSALLTGLGTVLPFAVVLALIGFPVWTVRRRRNVAPAQA